MTVLLTNKNAVLEIPIKITIGASGKTGSGSITLKFVVEAGGREMLADSELIDTRYRFILQ